MKSVNDLRDRGGEGKDRQDRCADPSPAAGGGQLVERLAAMHGFTGHSSGSRCSWPSGLHRCFKVPGACGCIRIAAAFVEHYGFTIDVLVAYRPTGKGRVERQVTIARDPVLAGRQAGFSIYFTTLDDLVRPLSVAEHSGRFNRQLQVYMRALRPHR